MTSPLEILLVKDVSDTKTRSRSMTLLGGTDGRKNEVAVIGIGAETFIWIGEHKGQCYGVLEHEQIRTLIEHYNDARTAEG